jgi:hypothetical protein
VLIASVQFTYNTRQFLWSAADVRDWWPEMQENSELETRLREEQAESFGGRQVWAKWSVPPMAPAFSFCWPAWRWLCRHHRAARRAACAGRRSVS